MRNLTHQERGLIVITLATLVAVALAMHWRDRGRIERIETERIESPGEFSAEKGEARNQAGRNGPGASIE
jgi:hypothetical protein